MSKNPLYVSKKGGAIYSFRGDAGLLFRVCSNHLSLYCNDLIAAKAQLDRLEGLKKHSNRINFQAMKREGQNLRALVESAAAPFLEQEA